MGTEAGSSGVPTLHPHSQGRWSRVHEKFLAERRPHTEEQLRRLRILSTTLITVGSIGFLVFLVSVLTHEGAAVLDRPVQHALEALRSPGLTGVSIGLAVVFGPISMPIVVAVTVVVWFLVSRHAWRPALLALAMITGVLIAEIIAHLVGRPRPPLSGMLFGADHTPSFPSGHVLGTANFLLAGSYLFFSRLRNQRRAAIGFTIAVLLLIAVAASRVYLGYHWPTDTLASVSIGLIELGVIVAVDTARTVVTTGHEPPNLAEGPETHPSAVGG